MFVGFAASSRTLRQAPQTLYKTVQCNNSDDLNFTTLVGNFNRKDHRSDFLDA
jgi:hypothetical protein